MKLTASLVASFILAIGAMGCIGAPVVPPLGVIYTDLNAPLTLGGGDFGNKRGESSVECILGLFSTGDGSVHAAAKNGGISQVKRVDYEFFNMIGLYQRYTTVAYGN